MDNWAKNSKSKTQVPAEGKKDSDLTIRNPSVLSEAFADAENAALALFALAGENPQREGLLRTPYRYAKAWSELMSGYTQSVNDVVGTGVFATESQGLVAVNKVEFFSQCEHHLLPFWGHASVAYFPSQKIVGLSKIPRILDIFARRLQVQERLTKEVGDALQDLLAPRALAVKISAQHMCMMMRGVKKQGSATDTTYVLGFDTLSSLEKDQLMSFLRN